MGHILILDIGKTNKKAFVFDEGYRIVFEKNTQFPETTDDDGDPCEDIFLLKNWVIQTAAEIKNDPRFQIRAVNCTAYGASFVHLDAAGQPLTPLYNYLKPYPTDLLDWFLKKYGTSSGKPSAVKGAEKIALETASPILGMLNSGLQLFWLKHRKPLIFNQIKWSLHLPNWVACLTSEGFQTLPTFRPVSEMTSLGCHTMLWDFQKNDYHDWAKAEGLVEKFPPVLDLSTFEKLTNLDTPVVGNGLHDSSAALIPYLASFREPFVLISTGTWCISLNPFNTESSGLTNFELKNDCLCYLTFEGKPVKAARYFGGNEHEIEVKKLAAEFGVAENFYQKLFPADNSRGDLKSPRESEISKKYAAFIAQLVEKQADSTRLAIGNSPIKRIFVDGGFSKNEIYMGLLAASFPEMEVFAAAVAQATALGAALAIHGLWNKFPVPSNLIALKHRSVSGF